MTCSAVSGVVPTNCRSMKTCAFGTSASMRNVPDSIAASAAAGGAGSRASALGARAAARGGAAGLPGVADGDVVRGALATGAAAGRSGVSVVRRELRITSTPITNAKQKVATARMWRFTRRFYVSYQLECSSGTRDSGSGTRGSGFGTSTVYGPRSSVDIDSRPRTEDRGPTRDPETGDRTLGVGS